MTSESSAQSIKNFKILGINHIGIACKDTDKGKNFLSSILHLTFLGEELVKDQHTLTHMFQAPTSRLELLQDAGDGPIGKFLEKKGAGLHHIALTVDNIDAALAYLKKLQVRLLDSEPRKGAHSTRIAFIHPEATGGFLLELVEEQRS